MTVLAGFRWVNLSEELEGILLPPTPPGTGPFWDTQTKNNLYGFQIGADAKLLERGRFSIDGVVKAGIYDNHAEEASSVRMDRIQFGESCTRPIISPSLARPACSASIKLSRDFRSRLVTKRCGCEGVAWRPARCGNVCHGDILPQDNYVQALGVNCNSGVFYHGATVGLEYSF